MRVKREDYLTGSTGMQDEKKGALILVSEDAKGYKLQGDGSLRDLSPILGMPGLIQPGQMTGGDLRVPKA